MAVGAGLIIGISLLLMLLVLALGFACYACRGYCNYKLRLPLISSEKRQTRLFQDAGSIGKSLKTTTDEETQHKNVITFEQILKKEEASGSQKTLAVDKYAVEKVVLAN